MERITEIPLTLILLFFFKLYDAGLSVLGQDMSKKDIIEMCAQTVKGATMLMTEPNEEFWKEYDKKILYICRIINLT